MIALQRQAKLTGERLRVFVVLNVSCGSAENYHSGTGGRRSFSVSRSVCAGMVEWARLPIKRCEGKEVWPRKGVVYVKNRQVVVLRLLDERPRQLLLPYHCCGTSRGEGRMCSKLYVLANCL